MDSWMSKWKCKKCKGYRNIDYEKIEIGTNVYFLVARREVGEERKKPYKNGVVVKKNGDLFHIECRDKIYKINKARVYPMDAPDPLVYNMFGECLCE